MKSPYAWVDRYLSQPQPGLLRFAPSARMSDKAIIALQRLVFGRRELLWVIGNPKRLSGLQIPTRAQWLKLGNLPVLRNPFFGEKR